MANPPKSKSGKNDFDYDDIVKTTSDHQKTLDDVQRQITRIIEVLSPILDKENFSEYFRQTSQSHTALSNALVEITKKVIIENPEVKQLISDKVNESDRKWVLAKVKSVWGFIIAIVLLLAGAWIDRLLR